MSEEIKTEWRDIWQEIITISRIALREKKFDYLKELEAKYPKDKMLVFEEGIAAECLKDEALAKEYYSKAANKADGLPVKHWKERAEYFLKRINERGCNLTTDLNPLSGLYAIQWNTYYNIHSYCHLHEYLCYLAISSVSRIHSEPAMAIVIFRTCLEIGLWSYYPEDVNSINKEWKKEDKKRKNRDIGLDDLLKEMKSRKVIKSSEYEVFDHIRCEGNLAAHPKIIIPDKKPFHYREDELIEILIWFNQTMGFLNIQAERHNQK